MADYWIKLYIEMLEDPKIGTLPDGLCWRFVQVCLLAGKYNNGGAIPNTPQLAWVLRKNSDDLDHELQQLAGVGLIERMVGGWFVKNFAKRQARMTNAEKQKAYRDRQHHEQYTDVTKALPNVTQITDNRLTDTDTDTDKEQKPTLFSLYENEIGIISPRIAEELTLAEKEYPAEWFGDAIKEAADHNARNWKYIHAILKNWKTNGRNNNSKAEKFTPAESW